MHFVTRSGIVFCCNCVYITFVAVVLCNIYLLLSTALLRWGLSVTAIFKLTILLVLSISCRTLFNKAKLASDRSSVLRFLDFVMTNAIADVSPVKPCNPKYSNLGSEMFSSTMISATSDWVGFHVQPGILNEVGFALMIRFIIEEFR